MRISLKRAIVTLAFILMIFILLWGNSSNSYIEKNDDLTFLINYQNQLLKELNSLVTKKSDISFENFTKNTLILLKGAPRSCDIQFVVLLPRCEVLNKSAAIQLKNKLSLSLTRMDSIKYGGLWTPLDCVSNKKVAIIIPFRSRWLQLFKLLPKLHELLQEQRLCYRIFVIEQLGSESFNKGRLNNAGFMESITMFHVNCVIFHDVDLIPENIKIPYFCHPERPVHMAVAVDLNNYRLPYSTLIGGVLAFTPLQFISVNGYSNYYWGWGLEDDDMELRLKTTHGYDRLPESLARYKSTSHIRQQIFKIQEYRRKPLLSTAKKRMLYDGLNSLPYDIIKKTNKELFTHIIVDIGNQPEEFYL